MGQWRHVIALDRRERLRGHFRLGELLLSKKGSDLVMPLAVPVVPRQFGVTAAPDATASDLTGKSNLQRVNDPMKSDDLSSKEQEESLGSSKTISIKRKSDNGPNPAEGEQKFQYSALDNINALPVTKSTCGLSRLPNELLDMIFQNLDIDHVFVLGLQSPNFWNVARQHIWAYLVSSCGHWAGNRIVCVGNSSESEDYPPNVLTESEKAEFDEEPWVSRLDNLFDLANTRYQEVREWQSDLAHSLIGHATMLGEWLRLPGSSQSRIIDDLLSYKLSDLYPEDQPWVLRNLTTQEYVRSEAIAIKPEHVHGPNIDFLGFGQVVCTRICWSTDDWSEYGEMHRGVWAGHRFDVTTLDRLKHGSMECTEWKDVSEEVMDEMERVLTQAMGRDWRYVLQRYR